MAQDMGSGSADTWDQHIIEYGIWSPGSSRGSMVGSSWAHNSSQHYMPGTKPAYLLTLSSITIKREGAQGGFKTLT